MHTSITKIVFFDAAHSLPSHEGKCRNLHGHTYTLQVTVSGRLQESGPADGMIMDFADLGEQLDRLVVSRLDHSYLNDLFDFAPTAEAVAGWVFSTLTEAGLPVDRVRLWETPSSYVDVTP